MDRQMDADDIGTGQHLLQGGGLRALLTHLLCRTVRIIGQDIHTECQGTLCHLPADGTVAGDTQGLTV